MNFTYRSVWCEKTQTYVAASELAKGRTKRGKVASAAISLLLGSLVTLENSAQAAMVVNGNPQEASPSCELMSDGSGTSWTVATSANCQVGTLAGTASGQGNPGQNAVFYSSTQTNGKEDSLNLGGYLDVWKGATFHAGLDMSQQKITNLADGSAATDAATFGQLNMATRYFKAGGLNDGTDDAKATLYGLAAGAGAFADANGGSTSASIALGAGAYAYSNASQNDQTGQGWDSIAIGSHSTASGAGAVALGPNANANYTNIAIGNLADASGGGRNAIAIGGGAKASTWYSVALGTSAEVSAANSVALGFNSLADRANTVSVGRAGSERQIVNMAKGTADTDAVNVAQLKGVTTALGGGAAVNADGTIKAPSYLLANANSIAGTSGAAADAGSGFAKVDSALGALNTTANKGFNISADAGATSQNIAPGGTAKFAAGSNTSVSRSGDTITYSIVSNPTFSGVLTANGGLVVGAGKTVDMGGNKLTNVAAGSAATDGVNKAQLDALNTIVTKQGTDTATNLGGGAAYNAGTGAISAPSYLLANANSIAGTSGAATDAGSGFAKVDAALGAVNAAASHTNRYVKINGANDGTDDASAVGNAMAIGIKAFASNYAGGAEADGLAMGESASATGVASTALGHLSSATASNSVALGNSSVADRANTVSVGKAGAERQIANMAKGTADTDAVNVAQLKGVTTALGGGAAVNADGTIKAPSYLLANANSIAGTSGAAADAGSGFAKVDSALGKLNTSVTQNTTDIAGNTTAITNLTNNISSGKTGLVQQSAAGANLTVGKTTDGAAVDFLGTAGARKLLNVADGTVAANSKDAVNGGQLFTTNQQVAQNTSSISNLDGRVTQNSTDINTINSTITNMGGTLTDAVKYDSATHDKVTLGNAGTPVQVTNVKAGQLSASSSDAVNGSQLYSTNQQVAQNTTDIAGNTSAITNLTNNISSGKTGLVQQSAAGANLTVGKTTDGAAVDFLGTAGARKLLNVADGTVAANSKDAVNGGQLFTTNNQVAQNTSSISNLDGRVTQNTTDISNITGAVTNMGGTLADAVKYDSAAHDKVTLGNAGTPVQVTNVKAGQLNANSSDAVNGSQLYSTNQQVAQNTTDIAGNTSAITNLTNNVNTGKTGLVQQSAAGANLTVGKTTDGAAVDFLGTSGARKLINVADGNVAAGSKEAVNGGQLFGVSQSMANAMGGNAVVNADGSISAPSYTVTNADGSTTKVTNVGDAISNIDGRVAQNTTDIAGNTTAITNLANSLNSGTVGMVQQSAAGANLTVGKDTDGSAVDFLGTAGARKLINVADGSVAAGSKEAVNGGQLFGVSQSMATALGGNAVVNADGSVSAPSYSVTNADGSTRTVNSIGDAISNIDGRTAQNTTDINTLNSTITTLNGVMGDVVKYDSPAHDKITLGKTGTAVQLTNLKAGELSADSSDAVNGSQLFSTNSKVAIIDGRVTNLEGNITNMISGGGVKYFHTSSAKADAIASGSDSVAIGGAAKASGDGSVALGDNAQASAKGSVAIGQNANDNGRGAESYTGQYSGAQNDSVGTVAVGNAATGETRTISGVADARQATDAVNLRQLDGAVAESKSYTDSKVSQANGQITDSIEKIDTRVTKVEGDVGNLQNGTDGMAQVNNASHLPKPKATGADSSAFGAGSEASGDNSIAMGTNAKAKGKNSAAIGANSVADRDNTVSMGSAGNERQITHVAAGVENTDAVNVGQMNDALGSVASQSNRQYNALKRDLEKQNDDLSAGIAGAIAIASLPQPMVNGGSTTSAGLGTYNGQSALSVGVAHVSNDGKWISKLGGSTDTQGHFSAGVSLGYNW